MSTKEYIIFVLFLISSTIIAFFSGYYLKDQIAKEKQTNNQTLSNQLFRPNFIDEAIFISKEAPRKALILSAIRTYSEPENNYTLKAFYYDGINWSREITEGKSNLLEFIPKTDLIPMWVIQNDPSYMLRQAIGGTVKINNNIISFALPSITNEIPVRSNYKYTKFMSTAEGKLIVNGEEFLSHALYSRIYSFNPPEGLIFTSNPAGIETEWLAFWDDENNFYSIDESIVNDKVENNNYKAHSMAVKKTSLNQVSLSFNLDLKEKNSGYTVNVGNDINSSIQITKINSVNKSVNGKDVWKSGIAEGFIQNGAKRVKGIGIFEEISQ